MKKTKQIQVFEFDRLNNRSGISEKQLKILQNHYGEKGVPYYNLIHEGVKFNNYVGVLQINDLTIEVLPKIDKLESENWRNILIQLLHFTGEIEVSATDFANLKMNKLSLLELYFSIFVKELEYLIHRGLIKKYRNNEGNIYSLKGALQFNKNITQNLIHKERFYTNHSVYDKHHLIHQILFEALLVVQNLTTSNSILSSINKLVLDFPEQKKVIVTDNTFLKISIDRKTEPYRKALNIARMILLNYHPNILQGNNIVLALFFDMNLLWEKYVAKVLKQYIGKEYRVTVQGNNKKLFWESMDMQNASIKPDILISKNNEPVSVIDTKWKLPFENRPSDEDLKQMFSYNNRYSCENSWLLYPNDRVIKNDGAFYNNHSRCGMILTPIIFKNQLNHEMYFETLKQLQIF